MRKILVVAFLACLATSCGNQEPENLMSPCVGKKGSPCDRVPVNQELFNKGSLKV